MPLSVKSDDPCTAFNPATRKLLFPALQAHVTTTLQGDVSAKKRVGSRMMDPCKSSCRYLCTAKITREARISFHRLYWGGSFASKRTFFLKFVRDAVCKNPGTGRRNRSTKYFMVDEEGSKVRVCRTMFLHTLGLRSDARMKSFRAALQKDGSCITEDKRGGNRRPMPTIDKAIGEHIQSYHPQISHYARKHAPLRRYLEASLSITKLYHDFLSTHTYMPISYDKYRKVFQLQRITFGSPEADICDLCEFSKRHLKEAHPPNMPACLDCGRIGLHRKFSVLCRTKSEQDANEPVSGDTAIFSVDMQSVLLIPIMKGKNYFFTSRLVCFNETFGALANARDIAVLWHEAIAGRSAADVASAFHLVMNSMPHIHHFVFWADNCGPQNKNWYLFSSLLQSVSSTSGPLSITLKYLEKGHTFMRSDSIHGMIGKALRKEPELFDYDDLVALLKNAKIGLDVISMSASDFRPFSSFHKKNAGLPKLNGVREVRFVRGSKNLYYKLDISAASYFSRTLCEKDIPPIPSSEHHPRGVNDQKRQEICRVLLPQMPEEKRAFWRNLPSGSIADLCSKQGTVSIHTKCFTIFSTLLQRTRWIFI